MKTRFQVALGLGLVFALGTFSSVLLAEEVKPAESAAPASPTPTPFQAAETATPDPVFTGEAAKIKKQFEELFESSRFVNQSDKKTSARGKIESALDWERIATQSLGTSVWKKTSASNRASFEKLLKDVILKTAFSRLDTFWTNTLSKFDEINVKGAEGHVKARFVTADKSFQLEYFVNKKGSAWKIYDVAFESERYASNINSKISAFLKEKPFSALLGKLKERRDELDQDAAAPKTKKS